MAGLALTELLIWFWVAWLMQGAAIGRFCAVGPVFMFNFLMRKAILFSRAKNRMVAYE